MSEQVTIARRFCGPPDSGNGGYVCGVLASFVDGPAEVTLRAPPPLEHALTVERLDGGGAALRDGDDIVAEASPATFDVEVPAPVDIATAQEAARHSLALDDKSPFRTCFVCGSQRDESDGLRIFPGLVDGPTTVAAPWTPDASLADDRGFVRPEFVWAALDCPSGFGTGFGPETLAVLGKLAAKAVTPVEVGRRYVVMGWSLGSEGRKLYGGSALFAEDGALCAYARATWVMLRK
ncbi:MAG: hypothetical protein WBD55_06625 [Dehalococcoidia bacterium]